MRLNDCYLASVQIRSVENDTRRVFGVASTDRIDRQNTIVDQVSLAKAAREYKKNKGKLFYNHNWAVAIGKTIDVFSEEVKNKEGERSRQLMVEGEVASGYPVPVISGFDSVLMSVDDIWTMIKQGVASDYSIGFSADEKPGELDSNGVRGPSVLIVRTLFEVSIVSIPANSDAKFSVTRALADPTIARYFSYAKGKELSRAEVWGEDTSAAAAAALALDALDDSEEEENEEELSVEELFAIQEELRQCRMLGKASLKK